jgi:hypothetical protein
LLQEVLAVNRTVLYNPNLDELVQRAYRLVQKTRQRLRLCEEAEEREVDWREASLNTLRRHKSLAASVAKSEEAGKR